MTGLIVLCLFSGLAMGGFMENAWHQRAFDVRPEIVIWPVGGMGLSIGFAAVGLWQDRKGKSPLGLSQGAFISAIAVSYVVGFIGGAVT